MRVPPVRILQLLGAGAMASCATSSPMTVTVGGWGTTAVPCFAEVDGQLILVNNFGAFAQRWRGREAQLRTISNTPYRCFGRIIYELQRAGFQRIGFIS